MYNKFEANGTLDLIVTDQILRLEGTGPWNLESLYQSGDQANPLIDTLCKQPWGVILILHGECIYVHAAGKRLSEIVRAEKERNRVATAVLVNDCDSPNFAKSHIGEIYENAGEHFAFFDDIDLAEAWLKQQLSNASQK